MKKSFISFVSILVSLYANISFAVDQSSSAYQAGNLVGKIFMAVLIFLIVKKYVFKK